MSYLQSITVFVLVLLPVVVPAAISGFHRIGHVLWRWRSAPSQTIVGRLAVSHTVWWTRPSHPTAKVKYAIAIPVEA